MCTVVEKIRHYVYGIAEVNLYYRLSRYIHIHFIMDMLGCRTHIFVSLVNNVNSDGWWPWYYDNTLTHVVILHCVWLCVFHIHYVHVPLQLGAHINSLHCAYDRVSCAGLKTVRLYDSHLGSLTKISVSIIIIIRTIMIPPPSNYADIPLLPLPPSLL